MRGGLLPAIGYLYPEGVEALNNSEDIDALGRALEPYWVYRRVFATAIQGEQMSVDDAFYLNEVRLLEAGFDNQFHLGRRAGELRRSVLLLLLPPEAAGNPKYRLDLRVYRAETAREDRQVYSHL